MYSIRCFCRFQNIFFRSFVRSFVRHKSNTAQFILFVYKYKYKYRYRIVWLIGSMGAIQINRCLSSTYDGMKYELPSIYMNNV